MRLCVDYVLSKKKIIYKPEKCPNEIYEKLMKPCFTFDQLDRPSFSDLIKIINNLEI